MKHAVRVDDFQGAQMCNTSQSCLEPHASACEKVRRCSNVRDTHNTERCACDEVFCLHTASRARQSLMSAREICEKIIYECARMLQSGCHTGFAKSL